MKQRVVTVTRLERGEEPVDRSWLDRTADERMMAVWQLTLECLVTDFSAPGIEALQKLLSTARAR